MNRKHVKSEMDSGLGSDEDRRGRTKEQKQLHNQQLLSGCFIDASSLSDDAEVVDQRRSDERRQGALIFQNSVPHFSMLQMTNAAEDRSYTCSSSNLSSFPDTSTPYNSIVQLDVEEASASVKSPLGFYVDLSNVEETPNTPPSASTTKNIFSMVIDFEGPKKDKPIKLSSSFVSHRRPKPVNKNLTTKANGNSLSSSYSSINSTSVAGTSRQSEESDSKLTGKCVSIEVLSASLVKNLSISSKSSSSSENLVRTQEELDRDSAKDSVEEEHIECDVSEKNEDCDVVKELGLRGESARGDSHGSKKKHDPLVSTNCI